MGLSHHGMLEEMVIAATEPWQAALKLAAGDPPEKAKANAAKHGASLRARAATWIKKKGKFKDSSAVDDKWTEQMEAGPIPQTYDEWV